MARECSSNGAMHDPSQGRERNDVVGSSRETLT